MGLFRKGPDTMELLRVSQILGVQDTLPISELRQSRKDWVRAWRKTRVSAGHFLVERYGLHVTEDGDTVPTRGAALTRPLSWDPRTGYSPESARRFIRDVRSGVLPATDK